MKKAMVVLTLLAVCAGANADVVTFTGTGQTADTMVASAAPMTGGYKFGGNVANYGGSDWFGTNAGGSNTKAILRFDVSALAGSFSSINSVTLRLAQRDTSTANVTLFRMNPADSNWEEGTDTASYSSGWWNRTSWSYCNMARMMLGLAALASAPGALPWPRRPRCLACLTALWTSASRAASMP